jgi:hypothetical protein
VFILKRNQKFVFQVPVSPTNLCKAQKGQHEVNDAKDAVLFHQHFSRYFAAYFRLQHLHRGSHLGTFLPNAVAVKSIKNNLRKNCPSLEPKMLEKLTPGANVIKQIPQ